MTRQEAIDEAVRHTFEGCPYVYMHAEGWHPAFYLTEKPSGGDIATNRIVRKVDGSKPEVGEAVNCGTCGKPVRSLRTELIFLNLEAPLALGPD